MGNSTVRTLVLMDIWLDDKIKTELRRGLVPTALGDRRTS